MERREIIYRMEKSVGGASFISRIELARFMGYKDPHYVDRFIKGLPRINKKYFIGDVATMLQNSIN